MYWQHIIVVSLLMQRVLVESTLLSL